MAPKSRWEFKTIGKKIAPSLKQLFLVPPSLKAAYLKSRVDYLFPRANLTRTIKAIFPHLDSDQIFEAINSVFYDKTLLEIRNSRAEIGGALSDDELNLLHALILLRRPVNVVETGVSHGSSSAAILSALHKNGMGTLFSIELSQTAAENTHVIGWLVPDFCKSRWKLLYGDSLDLLPPLLKSLANVDIFLHDSAHSYVHMRSELELIWPYLKSGGIVLVDDFFVFGHTAFSDFAKAVKKRFSSYSGIGIILK